MIRVVAWFAAATLLACQGELVTLGQARGGSGGADAGTGGSVAGAGGSPDAVAGSPDAVGGAPDLPELPRVVDIVRRDELSTEGENDNPTLTEDLLQIFFTSDRDGGPGSTDIWTARRTSSDEPFGAPELVPAASSEKYETSSAISLDGRTLWVGSERSGGLGELDVWVCQRDTPDGTWSEAVHVPALSSPEKDIPRPLGFGETVMPLASQRESEGTYRTFFARRGDSGFENPELVSELWIEDRGTVDGFLSADGRLFLFTLSAGEDNGDLYAARRATTDDPFREPEPLELNTDADERDPWLSPDGKRFFFASDRDGVLAIYEAEVRAD